MGWINWFDFSPWLKPNRPRIHFLDPWICRAVTGNFETPKGFIAVEIKMSATAAQAQTRRIARDFTVKFHLERFPVNFSLDNVGVGCDF